MPTPAIDLRRVNLASRMLRLGVRPHLVAYTTGLPQPTMIDWHQQITGSRTKRGPCKEGAASYVKKRADARRLSIFAVIYLDEHSRGGTLSERLITAIERYNALFPNEPIDGTLAWIAAREMDANEIKLQPCRCRAVFAHKLQHPRLRRCPFCDPRK